MIAVISARRPANVQPMSALLGVLEAVWYVADGDGPAYRAAGAQHVVEAGLLVPARNRALDDAAGEPCLQLSDDLRKIEITTGNQRADVRPSSIGEALVVMTAALAQTGYRLAGAAPTANAFYYHRPINTTGFVVGDLILVAAGCKLRFDEQLRLKEDYDYTITHLEVYGGVARCDSILASFRHRDNAGGAVAYRTETAEREAIRYLKAKWGRFIRDNPRRPNEVLLRWKPAPEPARPPA